MNKVVHFEIPYDDMKRAEQFYQETFDWQLKEMPEMSYTIATTVPLGDDRLPTERGAINGGMMQRTTTLSAPIITIQVDSVDEALKAVSQNGGTMVTAKQEIQGMGYVAYCKDTEGNVIGLWELMR